MDFICNLMPNAPLNVVSVFKVMSLGLLLKVVQHDDPRREVHSLSRRYGVQIGTAVASTVTIPGMLGQGLKTVHMQSKLY